MSHIKKKTARRLRRTVSEKDGAPALSVTAKSTLVALPITVAIGLLFLFIAAALLMTTADPSRFHGVVGLIVAYVTALVGGLLAVRLNRRRAPLLCGIGIALLLLIFITVLGACLPASWRSENALGIRLLMRAALFPVALIGAFWGAKVKKRRKRH